MFVMRRAKAQDVPTLLKLAKMVHFINLPADKDIIAEKVNWSRQCFQGVASGVASGLRPERSPTKSSKHKHSTGALNGSVRRGSRASGGGNGSTREPGGAATLSSRSKIFMFVLEDASVDGGGGVLGTSQIITSMGGPGEPNLSFELRKKEMFSTSLQTGATHIVARLKLDESGPTEIGGLILQPSYRGHKAKLGRFLSLVRFHFMGLYRPVVADRVLAELMGPITPDGQNTLWEYLGRRFINLTYTEADRFCQHSKEFMLSLLPREDIYLTLLPPEARRIIAQVGPETEPAKRMLEKLGFEYRNCIDPFDGGPNLEAATDAISIVRNTRRVTLGEPAAQPANAPLAIVSTLDEDGEFVALQTPATIDNAGKLRLPKDALQALQTQPGVTVGYTPLDPAAPTPQRKPKRAAARQ